MMTTMTRICPAGTQTQTAHVIQYLYM